MMYRCLYFILFPYFLPAQTFNIRDFGAKGDGKTLDTHAIQRAVDQAAALGGGTVLIPSGTFLSGTIFLFSNIELQTSPGAVLLGSANLADYDSDHPHLLFAQDAGNVALTGTGKIDGQGYIFYDTMRTNWTAKPRPSPWLLFENCTRIRIRDIQLHNSPAHVIVLNKCEDVVVEGISIRCDLRSPNTDGIDIADSRNVTISNCHLEAGDDLICLKSKDRRVENITVSNCILVSDDAAIKFGTGSHIGVRNCTFSNLIITGTRYGIALFMIDGGTHEHCLFENITIRTHSRWNNEYPIFIDIHRRTTDSRIGRIKDIQFRGLSIQTAGNLLMAGQPGTPIEDLVLEDVNITFTGCNNVTKYSQKPRGNKTLKPDPDLMDYAKIPAHITLAHIYGLKMNNIVMRKARKMNSCDRDAFWLKDLQNDTIGILDIGDGLKTGLIKN